MCTVAAVTHTTLAASPRLCDPIPYHLPFSSSLPLLATAATPHSLPLHTTPHQKHTSLQHTAWFHEPRFLKPSALHAELMSRSGRGQLEVAALTHLVRTSSSPRDAALALSSVSAVRHVALGEGRVAPWPDSFLKAFIKVGLVGLVCS